MRIGVYGMPTAGKTYLLGKIDFLEVVQGSKLLRQQNPDFDHLDEAGRKSAREKFAISMAKKQNFIMDGHYAFGSEVAFTDADGDMYDAIVYIYIAPESLRERMLVSERNQKYLVYDIEKWQRWEIEELRDYCHKHDKDFYVVDSPPNNSYADIESTVAFIKHISDGYSVVEFARQCADEIIAKSESDDITLLDGDKTITIKDTSNAVFGYTTHLYDGNFYTGYQSWKQSREFENYSVPEIDEIPVALNEKVLSMCQGDSYILTSGQREIWACIASRLGFEYYSGEMMSADAKYFITKYLQNAGKRIRAFGDGMNDYYMLKKADEGYLVRKKDGSISGSLKGRNLEGLIYV